MSEYKNNFPLYSLLENFTEDLEDSQDDTDSENGDSDYEFFNSCVELKERNISFLCKIFADNNENSSSSSESDENEVELTESDLESENENENELSPSNNNEEFDEIITTLEQKEVTACVIVDIVNGKFERCGQKKGNIRQLRNLLGTWQVDRDAVKEVNGNLEKLGVCDFHFQFDNKYLHKIQEKKVKNFEMGVIQWRRCIACDKYVTFFSRSIGCTQHSWHLNGHNIQVPCIGQYCCEALKLCDSLCVQAFDNIERPKSVCCSCYEKLGGHIY